MRSTARYRKTMVMRDHLSAAAVLSVVGVLSSFPASPAQARCNLMHDLRSTNPSDPTSADPAKPTIDFNSNKPVDAATKDEILNNIMETGIPCQETATGAYKTSYAFGDGQIQHQTVNNNKPGWSVLGIVDYDALGRFARAYKIQYLPQACPADGTWYDGGKFSTDPLRTNVAMVQIAYDGRGHGPGRPGRKSVV